MLGSHSVWRTDQDGSVRWGTVFSCVGEVHLLEYTWGLVLVAGSYLTPARSRCDEARCTYLFALDHRDGEILSVHQTAPVQPIGQPELPSVPGAMVADINEVWIASSEGDPPSRNVLLSRYVLDAGVAGVEPEHTDGLRLRARAAGATIIVDLIGTATPAVVRLYDVAGRLVARRDAARGAAAVRFGGVPPGVFFVEARHESGRAVAKVGVFE